MMGYNNSAPSAINNLPDDLVIGRDAIEEVNKVSGSIVKEAACRMKPGKSDVSGGYTSDALLNAQGWEVTDFNSDSKQKCLQLNAHGLSVKLLLTM